MAWQLELDEIISATKGKSLSSINTSFRGVGTDSRVSLLKQLFIPLKGESFDGHDFIKAAVSQGAAAILIHEWREEWKPLLSLTTFVKVPDTLKALQDLGRYWRRKHKYKVVAISGSNGKTTTKEFTYTLLQRHFKTHASKGSFNNHWGVPLSILQATPEHEVLVLEMGMNHLGELTELTGIAEPDLVAVTMVGRSHIGEVGSQEKIAQAKEEMYVSCPRAIQIFNIDNQWTRLMLARARERQEAGQAPKAILTFSSEDPRADVKFAVDGVSLQGLVMRGRIGVEQRTLTVKIFGRHNSTNLGAAAAIGLGLGLSAADIWQGLEEISQTSWGRNQLVDLQNGAQVLFDAYNANPDSMAALCANFAEIPCAGKKYIVLGDMLELGAHAVSAHRELGERVAALGAAGVLYQGQFAAEFAEGLKSRAPLLSSPDFDANLAKKFFQEFRAGDLIAVKGSRGMKLERILMTWNPVAFAEKS